SATLRAAMSLQGEFAAWQESQMSTVRFVEFTK
ncbi:unnamed protein product, partial [marine sediment metagenome]